MKRQSAKSFFIGRDRELSALRSHFEKREGQLIAVMGRRRIGKSRLIQEFAKEADVFYEFQGLATGPGIDNAKQLKVVADQISKYSRNKKIVCENWSDVFASIDGLVRKSKKTIIFLDEISWMAQNDLEFVGRLKIAWDTKFIKHKNLIVILCGSVSSWIEENVLKRADFVGRVNATIRLEELPLDKIRYFWNESKKISPFEIYKVLSVTGGVPKYLSLINPKLFAEDNIKNLCFSPEGFLVTEFEKFFNDIFLKKAETYQKIVKILSAGKKTLTQVCTDLKIEKNGVVLKHLDDLVEARLVERDWVYKSDGKVSKFSQFRLSDNYIRFYLKYIAPNATKIQNHQYRSALTDHLPHWASARGLQFENLMLKNQHLIFKALNLTPHKIKSSSPYFQNKTSKNKGACQIDLLIQSHDDLFYIVEFKFKKYISTEVIQETKKKVNLFNRPKYTSIRTVLVYCGELAEEISQSEVFDAIIDAGTFLLPPITK